MILCLICLQLSDCSQLLLDLLSGRDNIAYLLPKKFVYDLLRRRKGRYLNLNPEVSTNPCSLCYIWDPAGKSKEEILSVLFPRKTTLNVQKPPKNDDIGTILETPSSNTLQDEILNVNPVELQMNWEVLEDISEAINGTKGLVVDTNMIKNELDKNIGTLTMALADKISCAGKDATVVHEANLAKEDLKLLSSSVAYFSQQIREHSLVMMTVQGVVERLQSKRPKIDEFLNPSTISQESNTGHMAVLESSSTSEVGQTSGEKNHVKGTCDDSPVVENQSGGVNTQDARNKKGKGKKNRKNKGKKK
ncbi:hypothetical protein HanHA300_Chr08g0280351 [Helianthus annuus]|nr:hypothetical protein HanHA300_Chr08g0280351 [Helianthus annuus]